MAIVNYAESWTDVYEKYKSVINFVAGDFDSLKQVIREYVVAHCPENFNDWAESSEVGIFTNSIAYLGETLHYRVDANAHDLFPSTTDRRESLINFTKMLSYSVKRNICANGIAKISSISTTQELYDTFGTSLKNSTIKWNDTTNNNWLEQFLTVINASISSTNQFGTPLKKVLIDGISNQLYEFNTERVGSASFSFNASVNNTTLNFEAVNPDIDKDNRVIFERTPRSEQAFNVLYRNDGSGYGSINTGFFIYWKQGSLSSQQLIFDEKIPNNFIDITDKNINEQDVWFQKLNSNTLLVETDWVKLKPGEYIVYNSESNTVRDIYSVETREGDAITLRFADGKFGNIPFGTYKVWYRVSNGNDNIYIKTSNLQNKSISIPYKSNNVNDSNTYYLNIAFDVVDISHIRQGLPSEDIEEIRKNAPEVYSTQNRMVSSSDYNYFPKSNGQQVKVVKSVNRTYSGNSRYIKLNDPTGTYKPVELIADDGYVYSSNTIQLNEVLISNTDNAYATYTNYIEPMLSSIEIRNLYYDNYNAKKIPVIDPDDNNGITTVKTILGKWIELYQIGNNCSYGYFGDTTSGEPTDFETVNLYIKTGEMVLFKEINKNGLNEEVINEVWGKIILVDANAENSPAGYIIAINELLTKESATVNWYATSYYSKFNTILTDDVQNKVINALSETSSFGLTYNIESGEWLFIQGGSIYIKDGEYSWKVGTDDNGYYINDDDIIMETQNDGDIDLENNITALNWIIRVTYTADNMWKFEVRNTDYIFGSAGQTAFFFNSSVTGTDIEFISDDIIKIYGNSKYDNQQYLDDDYFWKPYKLLRYEDGYVDTQRFYIKTYDSDKDGAIDNPVQYNQMMGDSNKSTLYFLKNTTGTDEDEILSNVTNIETFWDNMYSTISGNYYAKKCGTIFVSGMILPVDVRKDPHKTIITTNGSRITGDILFTAGKSYIYDIICDKDLYIDNNGNYYYIDKATKEPFLDFPNKYPTDINGDLIDYDLLKDADESLCNWNATYATMTKYSPNEYYTEKGLQNLTFMWKHYPISDYLIDPCPTNIIDTYVLTTTYYDDVQAWLDSDRTEPFPKTASSYELKGMFYNLEEYKMLTDELVWHPISYKLLFGDNANAQYRATFRVIKNNYSTMSDNEIKQAVLKAIDEYFTTMKVGESFYFTDLSTYIHKQLLSNINEVVIVPSYQDKKFGNLFQVDCDDDEILLSVATMDNIQIIPRITNYNIKIGS